MSFVQMKPVRDAASDYTEQQFRQQPGEFFAEGTHLLVHQWNACLTSHQDCF
jgi:hypothetical protein